ncbi:sugar phosphate isomerase/epimerase [Acidobacteria bacterium AH-259-L09]|nr:sugar phosphate isomerase/epimerase [Acidobacteria bacterium AH-259-L09]
MKIALCNEVLRELEFPAQCAYAAGLGYDGLELAPFTLGETPHLLSNSDRARLRRAAADAGIEIVGLHWLLVTPQGLSINSRDASVRRQTVEVMRRLIELCADLEGKVLVHGSPGQRQVEPDDDPAEAWKRALDSFAAIKADAEAADVVYCIEPLSQSETNFINTVAEAVSLVEAVGSPALRTMIDTRAARLAEDASVAELIDHWLPKGMVAHIHVNDRNRRGPGQGDDEFAPVFAALVRNGYSGKVSVEPFDYEPDSGATAAHAIGYIRGILQTLEWKRETKGTAGKQNLD